MVDQPLHSENWRDRSVGRRGSDMIDRPGGAMKQPVERRLAAILAADVAGYSRLMGADEAGTAQALRDQSRRRRSARRRPWRAAIGTDGWVWALSPLPHAATLRVRWRRHLRR